MFIIIIFLKTVHIFFRKREREREYVFFATRFYNELEE